VDRFQVGIDTFVVEPGFGDIDHLAVIESKAILSNVWIIQKLVLETAEGLAMLNGRGKPI
jgi:hypothetical protein